MPSQTFPCSPFPMPGPTFILSVPLLFLRHCFGRIPLRGIVGVRAGFRGRAHVGAISGTDCEISHAREHQQIVGAVNICFQTE
jgi:hypothetical protein